MHRHSGSTATASPAGLAGGLPVPPLALPGTGTGTDQLPVMIDQADSDSEARFFYREEKKREGGNILQNSISKYLKRFR
jgi:hypothetical protein